VPTRRHALLPEEVNLGLSASLEDYLETISHLEQSHQVARAKDIADQMRIQRASVTGALKILAGRGLINYSPYSYITLTLAGSAMAKDIIRRHQILKDFLIDILHLGPEDAEANAHRMEHSITPAAIDKLVCFLEFINICPRTDMKWLDAFSHFCANRPHTSDCRACLETCIQNVYRGEEGSRYDIDITGGVEGHT